MLQLSKTVDIAPKPASDTLPVAEQHYTHGKNFVEVDIQDDRGRSKRIKATLTPIEQAALEAIVERVINEDLNVTTTKVADPDPKP